MTEITTATGKTVRPSQDECEAFFTAMSPLVNAENARSIMTGLSACIEAYSLRLRLTIDQAIKGGMTCYWSVQEAFVQFPTFPWARYIEADFRRYSAAVALVGDDEYYGFHSTLGDAASTKYKSLSWLAMHLLVTHCGSEYGSLTRYASYNRTPDHKNNSS